MFSLVMLVVGLFVGWAVPQPAWAAAVVAWVKKKLHIGSAP